MAGTSPTISTNNTSFNVGDTLSITITFGTSRLGTLYIGDNSISIPQQKTPSYTYDYVLTTSGNYSVYFQDDNVLDSNTINISVDNPNVFLTKITKVKNALENVFVKKSDIKDNLTSTDTDKPLSANQGKELKTLVDGKANSNHNHTDYVYSNWSQGTGGAVSSLIKNKNLVTNNSGTVVLEQKNNHNHGYITNNGYLDGIFETTNELSIIEPYISDSSGNEYLYTLNGKLVYDGDNEILVYDKEGFTEIGELDASSEIATLDDIPNVTDKEDKSNKSSSITTDTGSTTKYPTVKAVEDYAQPIGNYLTTHQDITGKADNSDFDTVTATVTYTDNTSETVTFYIVPNNSS